MDIEKLKQKVKDLFEKQEFSVKKAENGFKASKHENELSLKVFSADKYDLQQVKDRISDEDKIFVDKGLEKIKDKIENPVSIIRTDEKKKNYDLPSYELIGEIAVINELTVEKDEAVEGILEHHPSVKTILLKDEPLQGEYRVGEYRKLYGEETETVHKEFGCSFKVDPTKVYYSERFSTERKRVIDQIQEDEKVLVMFAGVGPFAIMAAKHSDAERVVAVEKNPEAAKFLKENIELNNLEKVVEGFEGDVENVVPELDEEFDRIIMPLPESANEFLDLAFKHSKPYAVIHYYGFLEDHNWSVLMDEIKSSAEKTGREYNILDKTLCGQRAANIDRVCIDTEVE